MTKYSLIIVYIGIFFMFSCKEDSIQDFTILRYGTSFGECIGYCIKTITLQESTVTFEKSSWMEDTDFPNTGCTDGFPQFSELKDLIDINSFYSLPETIGCPDCADGGAEWIELESASSSHKVIFEYNNAPDEFNEYIEDLRFYVQRMEATCP